MKILTILLLLIIIACKEHNTKSPALSIEKDSIDAQTIPDHINDPSAVSADKKSVNSRTILVDASVKIPICTEEKSLNVLDVYESLYTRKNIVRDTTIHNLYYGSEKKAFDKVFQSQNIDCILTANTGPYRIFDKYYGNLKAEVIYQKIKAVNTRDERDYTLHDFFKRGLVFVLDEDSNKITMITFNPFSNNKRPAEVSSYFLKNKSKFDKVMRIVGIGHLKILVG